MAFEEGVEPVAAAIKAVARERGLDVAKVQRAAGWKGTVLYRLLDGTRNLRVTHLDRIGRAMGYAEVGRFYRDLGLEMVRNGPENAPGSPRTDDEEARAVIPLDEHRAVVRAFQAQIEHLRRGGTDSPGAGGAVPEPPLPRPVIDQLDRDAAAKPPEKKPEPPEREPPAPGSRHSKGRGRGRSKGQP